MLEKGHFFDTAIAGYLAKRGLVQKGSKLFGKAFESFIFHELKTFSAYSRKFFDIAYWRTAGGVKVDFILGQHKVAIEVKATERTRYEHTKGLVSIMKDYDVKKRIIVSLEQRARVLENGIEILPWKSFCKKLWKGEII